MVNNSFAAVPFGNSDNGGYIAYYSVCLADSAAGATPILGRLSGQILSGTFPAPNATYPNSVIDIYLVDPAALGRTNFWPKPLVHRPPNSIDRFSLEIGPIFL